MSTATITEETKETRSGPVPGTGHEGQTFLVGEEVYLRAIETADAKVGMSWRSSLFPAAPERIEEWIKDDLAKDDDNQTFAIVRKADDRVVGSVKLHFGGLAHWLEAKADPLYGERGLAWKGEAIALVADWIVNERGQPMVALDLPADEIPVIAAIERAGMREVARFREMYQRNGGRVDRVLYELLGSTWVANLGDPMDAPLARTGTGEARPVPPPVTLDADPPRNALMVGSRVYLRPEEPDDADPGAEDARMETESFFDIGRHLTSSVMFREWIADHEKKDLPDWITFAVCLRETDEVIGWVGLLDVDYQNRFAETGSFFRTGYRGSGYGSEAKQLLLEYAFERLGLHMLQSWVFFDNTRSAAALRKQGYKEAGRINWLYANKGTLDNMVVFDLLAEEWRAMPREAWEPKES